MANRPKADERVPSAATVKAQRGVRLHTRRKTLDRKLKPLSVSRRRAIVDAWCVVLEGLYAHLPLKRGLYGYDVLRALEHLKRQAPLLNELQFHRELMLVINRLKDSHTQYQGPESLQGSVASLPFLVEAYGPANRPEYIVSKVADGAIRDPDFVPGVKVREWNGIAFERAVDLYAQTVTGGRPDSRRATGLETMTQRALAQVPAPDEDWVVVGYEDLKGRARSARFWWNVVRPNGELDADRRLMGGPRAINFAAEAVRRAKKMLFNPLLWEDERRPPRARSKRAKAEKDFGDYLQAKTVRTKHGEFGLLRIWSFEVDEDGPFIDAALTLLADLPQRGLIIDVRANPGGLVSAAERLLQLFTPHPVVPTKFAWRVTPLTAAMARSNHAEFEGWTESVLSGMATGEPYTSHLPVTPIEDCNDLGQRYGGPIVLVCDATTYSAGDLFTAGIRDNRIGPVVCVGEATGAGGACVWVLEQIREAMRAAGTPLPTLPKGVSIQLSVLRAVRSGVAEGVLIEDAGVPGQPYVMTERDVRESNEDLLEYCTGLLVGQAVTQLDVFPKAGKLELRTEGLAQVDVYFDGRPSGPPIPIPRDGRLSLPALRGARSAEVVGWARGKVRQRRRLQLE